jgi:hypothetical protein
LAPNNDVLIVRVHVRLEADGSASVQLKRYFQVDANKLSDRSPSGRLGEERTYYGLEHVKPFEVTQMRRPLDEDGGREGGRRPPEMPEIPPLPAEAVDRIVHVISAVLAQHAKLPTNAETSERDIRLSELSQHHQSIKSNLGELARSKDPALAIDLVNEVGTFLSELAQINSRDRDKLQQLIRTIDDLVR